MTTEERKAIINALVNQHEGLLIDLENLEIEPADKSNYRERLIQMSSSELLKEVWDEEEDEEFDSLEDALDNLFCHYGTNES